MSAPRFWIPTHPSGWVLLIGCILLAWIRNDALIDPGLAPSQMLLGLMTAALGTLAMTGKKSPSSIPGFVLLLLLSWALSWWSWSGSIDRADGLYALAKTGLNPAFAGILWVLLASGKLEPRDLLRAGAAFGIATMIPALLDLLKTASGGHFLEEIYQVKGTFQHKNLLSGALLLGLIFSLISARETERSSLKWIGGALLLLVLVLRTRGVWLGIIVGLTSTLGLVAILHRQSIQALRISGFWRTLGLLALAAFVSSLLLEAGQSTLLGGDTLNHRLGFWKNTWAMIQDHPLQGVGPMNWRIHFVEYGLGHTDYNVMNGITSIQRPHNDYLWVLAEQGWPGFLLFLGALAMVKISALRSLKTASNPQEMLRAALVFGGFVAFAVFALGDFPSERSPHSALWMMLWVVAVHSDSSAWSIPLPNRALQGLLLGLIGLGIWGFWAGKSRMEAEERAKILLDAHSRRNVAVLERTANEVPNAYYALDNFSNPFAYYAALGAYASGKVEPARAGFLEALEWNPWHVLSLKQLGDIEKGNRRYAEALAYYERCLTLSPGFEAALLNKAEVLHALGRSTEALHSLHLCTLRIQNPKFDQLSAQILPVVLEQKRNQTTDSKLLERLRPYAGQPEQLAAEYRAYRLEVWKQSAQLARSAGKKD
ncbi:tetratricopeptide repeat protein [bacterium]|nr:tetratricopeptide repeat protein [bacterium]